MKNCWYCQFIHLNTGWGGSMNTPGDAFELICRKAHWRIDGDYCTETEARRIFDTADHCADFLEVEPQP